MYGLNGVQLGGPQWDAASYPAVSVAEFLNVRKQELVRVPLNVRAIYPTDGQALNGAEVAKYRAFADACYTNSVKVIWDLHTSGGWPLDSGTTRITLTQLTEFWIRVDASPIGGAHQAVIGYSLLHRPTMARTSVAAGDAGVVNGATNWAVSSDPSSLDTQRARAWLEDLIRKVVSALRSAGSTKRLYVPVLTPSGRPDLVGSVHTSGAYVQDPGVWYEFALYPVARYGANAEAVTKSFAAHNADFAGFGEFVETTYRTPKGGLGTYPSPIGSSDIVPLPLREQLPEDPLGGGDEELPTQPDTFPIPAQPSIEPFPPDRNFRPANWLKSVDQVEDGL